MRVRRASVDMIFWISLEFDQTFREIIDILSTQCASHGPIMLCTYHLDQNDAAVRDLG